MTDKPPATAAATPASPRAPAAQAATRPVPAWAVWSLRVIVLTVAVLVLLQPVFAGRFLTGEAGMLSAHSTVAGFITALAFLQFAAAILVWRPGRGPSWPIWASLAFFLLAQAQSALGYTRVISLHVPLGVLLFGFAVVMVMATWSPRLRSRRSRPHQRRARA